MARSHVSGPSPLLRVSGLTTRFLLPSGEVPAVEDVSLEVGNGEILGLVGESGSGKSATVLSILRLLPPTARILGGDVELDGESLLTLSADRMRRVRGNRIALVPQNPLAALNPVFTIGWQLSEAITAHGKVPREEVQQRIVEALRLTGLADPERQLERYPHEFSGGMRQRILIAMAILNNPVLLLADEPTTALDTTTQAQILALLQDLVARYGMGLLLITHNMGVIAGVANKVAVMYAGEIVETGPTDDVFGAPQHPYTQLLLASSPVLGARTAKQKVARAKQPEAKVAAGGCRFRLRCPIAVEACTTHPSLLPVMAADRLVRCWVAQAGPE